MNINIIGRNIPNCAYCEQAKATCLSENQPYQYQTLTPELLKECKQLYSNLQGTLPIVTITEDGHTRYIGGAKELKQFLTQRKANAMITG